MEHDKNILKQNWHLVQYNKTNRLNKKFPKFTRKHYINKPLWVYAEQGKISYWGNVKAASVWAQRVMPLGSKLEISSAQHPAHEVFWYFFAGTKKYIKEILLEIFYTTLTVLALG